MALCHAQAGSDIIAPSDMMDGRIKAIREILELNNLKNTLILSYTAKYASNLYFSFRDAVSSDLNLNNINNFNKKTYQMDYSNAKEAEKEALLDIQEGADILMVKPALSYLDIIYRVSQVSNIPVFAYSVSGEYSMLKALNNINLEKNLVFEFLTCIFRAGASSVLTYHAKQVASWLSKN